MIRIQNSIITIDIAGGGGDLIETSPPAYGPSCSIEKFPAVWSR